MSSAAVGAHDEDLSRGLGPARPLRYRARAGLLPELSRQTYDSLYKALREVVLNGFDASASMVEIDARHVEAGKLIVRDNGTGMGTDQFESSFMGLGGSEKYGSPSKFGRIGIGSLALLHYGGRAEIDTKVAGTKSVVRARLTHPWSLDRVARGHDLASVVAGEIEEAVYAGSPDDHFTEIRLEDLSTKVIEDLTDVGRFYGLLEHLRRILPLPWPDSHPLIDWLGAYAPVIWRTLDSHASEFAGDVRVLSRWGNSVLTRRLYGEESDERWDGEPHVIDREIIVPREGRSVRVLGYFLSQSHTAPRWAGLTARVQNVAVEERTFFDVESDPGFRKYLTGEVFVAGDVDRSRLVNIDRASFNRESPDYAAVQRYLADEVIRFKAARIQAPRRRRVEGKRTANRAASMVGAVIEACSAASIWCHENGIRTLGSSGIRVPRDVRTLTIADLLGQTTGVVVTTSYSEIAVQVVGDELRYQVPADVARPMATVGTRTYEVRFIEDRRLPPVVVRARPAELLVNTAHPSLGKSSAERIRSAVALEMAYLASPTDRAGDLYTTLLEIQANFV